MPRFLVALCLVLTLAACKGRKSHTDAPDQTDEWITDTTSVASAMIDTALTVRSRRRTSVDTSFSTSLGGYRIRLTSSASADSSGILNCHALEGADHLSCTRHSDVEVRLRASWPGMERFERVIRRADMVDAMHPDGEIDTDLQEQFFDRAVFYAVDIPPPSLFPLIDSTDAIQLLARIGVPSTDYVAQMLIRIERNGRLMWEEASYDELGMAEAVTANPVVHLYPDDVRSDTTITRSDGVYRVRLHEFTSPESTYVVQSWEEGYDRMTDHRFYDSAFQISARFPEGKSVQRVVTRKGANQAVREAGDNREEWIRAATFSGVSFLEIDKLDRIVLTAWMGVPETDYDTRWWIRVSSSGDVEWEEMPEAPFGD